MRCRGYPEAIILVSTRELAAQVQAEAERLTAKAHLKVGLQQGSPEA